ncbi:protein phosphatase 2C family protein [Planococcus sp. CP5-4]|uniref:protein phosphatase 2C domain-containing protein n=1 Tax=unclassified Planococcus (in: firmicutes) TaxID=2662419 RepID=UPI001C227223|nr:MULTISPECIES: protein phosphatase 2C domain-containing protein [unclassified Planococcus (in: firmicutes)]MBU9674469.1 protein phosphatase 2C family protein [Planococcus sp. CP5-4_YE]MBV0910100.1 protein phosphatase 2C family protein [Planococcus sp. CP5-4_UN]MBW6064692.1 protein phosphatase 2C family protein [Planococcus sp. CP5-4]
MANRKEQISFNWVGSEKHFVDQLDIRQIGPVAVGRFGGNSTAGQTKNEDGCLVWANAREDWEFTVLLDAHQTAESAELVVAEIGRLKTLITEALKSPVKQAFSQLSEILLASFESERFKTACSEVQGETAVLCTARKGKFLWWLSVGDCLVYLFHPELEALGEMQQNHRSFYEWIGKANTFELPVPCFSTGAKELRKGVNHILMTTDGLVECPNTDFSNPLEVAKRFEVASNIEGVQALLQEIKEKEVRDSTTILSWMIEVESEATRPGDEPQ